MSEIGTRLAEARAAEGLTLEAVSRRTRIAVEHLSAIEEGRHHDLPAGPYQKAWIRAYCEEMGVAEPEHTVVSPPEHRIPLSVVRGVGLVAVFALVGLVAWAQWGRSGRDSPSDPVVAMPDQRVSIEARRSVSVRVDVDGEARFDDLIPAGTTQSFEAFDRIEVRVPAVDGVRLRYNGQSIVPQGRQDVQRTLVFIDDGHR